MKSSNPGSNPPFTSTSIVFNGAVENGVNRCGNGWGPLPLVKMTTGGRCMRACISRLRLRLIDYLHCPTAADSQELDSVPRLQDPQDA